MPTWLGAFSLLGPILLESQRGGHTWPRVFARNMVFCHVHRTSDDARNRVELWGVMIHVESWAKSNICVIFSCMFDFDEDSTWIMTPHSSTLFLASSEVLWPLHKTMLRATTYPHVCFAPDTRTRGLPLEGRLHISLNLLCYIKVISLPFYILCYQLIVGVKISGTPPEHLGQTFPSLPVTSYMK